MTKTADQARTPFAGCQLSLHLNGANILSFNDSELIQKVLTLVSRRYFPKNPFSLEDAMPQSNAKSKKTPEEFFSELVKEQGSQLSDGDLRLLLSGLQAIREARSKMLNEGERNAVQSLIDCIAYEQKLSTETVTACLTTKFVVAKVEEIPSDKYHDAIAFLVDLQERVLLN